MPLEPITNGYGSWWRHWRAWLVTGLVVVMIGAASCQSPTAAKHGGVCAMARGSMDFWTNAIGARPLPAESWPAMENIATVAEKTC